MPGLLSERGRGCRQARVRPPAGKSNTIAGRLPYLPWLVRQWGKELCSRARDSRRRADLDGSLPLACQEVGAARTASSGSEFTETVPEGPSRALRCPVLGCHR